MANRPAFATAGEYHVELQLDEIYEKKPARPRTSTKLSTVDFCGVQKYAVKDQNKGTPGGTRPASPA
jgi:hypothetical protein